MQSLGHSVGDDYSHKNFAAASNVHISNVVFVVTECIYMHLCMWTHYNIMHLSSSVVVVVVQCSSNCVVKLYDITLAI